MDPTTFSKLEVGDLFTIKSYPGRQDGMAVIFTKIGETDATDDTGEAWDMTNSLYLEVFKQ